MKTLAVILIYFGILFTLTSEKPAERILPIAPLEKKEIRYEVSQHDADSLKRLENIKEQELKEFLINYKIDDISAIIENR